MTDAAERLSHHVTTTAGAAQYPEERVTNAVEALVLHLDLTHEQEDAALPFIEALLAAGAAAVFEGGCAYLCPFNEDGHTAGMTDHEYLRAQEEGA